MSPPSKQSLSRFRAPAIRGVCFFLFWLAISGLEPGGLPIAVAAAAAAAWVSLVLLPPGGARLRLGPVLVFALDFLRLSFVSGFDVARRALGRNVDLRPGFVTAPLRLRPGFARDAFCALASLLPGTLPTGVETSDEQALLVHGLDVRQPIAAEIAAEEALFRRTLGHE